MSFSRTSERSVHPNETQIGILLDNLERNPDMARGFLRTHNARQKGRTFWEQMQLQLNSVGGGTTKTWKQWMKYWTDKKSATKRKAALRAANRRRTGGGSAEVEVELTAVDERIVAMMGGEGFSTGDSHLRTPLIHEPSIVHENADISIRVCQEETELPEVIFTYENATETLNTPEPMAGTSHAGPQMSNQAALPDIPESENTPVIQRRSPGLQTPTQSPRRQRTSVTNSPRRRHRIRVRASPPSQRQSQFARTTERFVRLEERRMDIEESNASLLRAVLERTAQREHTLLEALTNVGNKMNEQFSQQNAMMAEAFKTLGEGLRALSDAIKPRN